MWHQKYCSHQWHIHVMKRLQTLPEKFARILKTGLAEKVNGKTVAIKMHVGTV